LSILTHSAWQQIHFISSCYNHFYHILCVIYRPDYFRITAVNCCGKNAKVTAMNLRETLHQLADQLPESATWKDVLYEIYIHHEIEAGMEEARRGEFASDDEVKAAFAKWSV